MQVAITKDFHILFQLSLNKYYQPLFPDEKTKAKKVWMACPSLHDQQATEQNSGRIGWRPISR